MPAGHKHEHFSLNLYLSGIFLIIDYIQVSVFQITSMTNGIIYKFGKFLWTFSDFSYHSRLWKRYFSLTSAWQIVTLLFPKTECLWTTVVKKLLAITEAKPNKTYRTCREMSKRMLPLGLNESLLNYLASWD